MRARLRRAGLGFLVGAVFHAGSARAQDTTRAVRDTAAIRDSIAADAARRTTARLDSIRAVRAADSIKAPIARAELPVLADIGRVYRWDRRELFASGALTLNDLLERIPGVTPFQSGWIPSPQHAALGGDFGAIRVFLDGFEMDALNPRTGGVRDLSNVPLWTLDEVRIERAGNEIRVHLHTWTVRSTTPSTRVDVATGDFDTNTYRGYFGRRFSQGALLQLGAFQYATQNNQLGDADHLALFARTGWAKGRFSVVGTYYTLGLDRSEQLRRAVTPPRPNLPRQDARYTQAYARVGYGSPSESGLWAQVSAGQFEFHLTRGDSLKITPLPPPPTGPPGTDTTVIKRDTLRTQPQYVAAVGYGLGALRVSATANARNVDGELFVSPSVRASVVRDRAVASVFAEQHALDSTLTTDATVRLTPLSFVAVTGSVGRSSPVASAQRPTALTARGELGLRLGRVWVSGGAILRDTAVLRAPVVFDTAFQPAATGRLTGTFATVRGRVLGDLGVDIVGTRWDTDGFYRPRFQSRSQLYLDTQWRSAVESGNLNIFTAVTHEYRGGAFFPVRAPGQPLRSSVYRTWGMLLEVRILRAVLSYQFRNVVGLPYEQVPGFLMPRQTNLYGVRWEFVN